MYIIESAASPKNYSRELRETRLKYILTEYQLSYSSKHSSRRRVSLPGPLLISHFTSSIPTLPQPTAKVSALPPQELRLGPTPRSFELRLHANEKNFLSKS